MVADKSVEPATRLTQEMTPGAGMTIEATIEVGQEDVTASGHQDRDEVDIMVDALQLQS